MPNDIPSARDFLRLNVSRETFLKMEQFDHLLRHWQPRINLVATATLSSLWERHILDCWQLTTYLPDTSELILDIGSGAGFPGIILAICGYERLDLCESDRRKAAFLLETCRLLSLPNRVLVQRVESVNHRYDVVVARACASIELLLAYAHKVLSSQGRLVLLKGSIAKDEIKLASKKWSFDTRLEPSISSPEGNIVILSNIQVRA